MVSKTELGRKLHGLNAVLSASTLREGAAGELTLPATVYPTNEGTIRTAEKAAVVPSIISPDKTAPGLPLNILPMSFSETKVLDIIKKILDRTENWLLNTCDKEFSGFFLPGECSNGHRVAKEIVCGKEWCPKCGEDGSLAHRRRFARWLSKVMQMFVMGYWVFTIPEELRVNYRTKKSLRDLAHAAQEILKKYGCNRGLSRWHWFGDKSTKWHPHLNILVDGGFMSQDAIKSIKIEYCALLGYKGNPNTVAHYQYRKTPGKMVHTLKYVTRATFHNHEWDYEMAVELRGFRNMVVWGKYEWNMPHAWELDELKGPTRAELEGWNIGALEKLADGKCPVCGEAIAWQQPLPHGLLDIADKVAYGCGYYLVKGPAPPGPRPAGPPKLTAEQLKAHAEEHLRLDEHRRIIHERYDGQQRMDIQDYSRGY